LHLVLRHAYLTAAVLLLLVMSWSQASVVLVLFVAADLGAAALMLRPAPAMATPHVATIRREIPRDSTTLTLFRRTVPELRMRRSAGAIDAQMRWRLAAEACRQRRELG
jgi:hypothetical protein